MINLSIGVRHWGLECAFKSSLKGTEFGGRATDCRESQMYSCISRYIQVFNNYFTSIFICFTLEWIRNSFFIIFCSLTEAETIKYTTNNSRDSNCSPWLPPKGLLYSFRGIPPDSIPVFGIEKCLSTIVTGNLHGHYY